MRGTILGVSLLVCLFCVYSGTAEAVSLQVCEDLALVIPNTDLNLGPNVRKAPKIRLERYGELFPLTVNSFVPGARGAVTCDLPSGLDAGHYSIYVLKGGKWVRAYTLVKVLAPVINSVAVTGGGLGSGAQVTLEGLFFSASPTVSLSLPIAADGVGAPLSASRGMVSTSAVMDPGTGLSQVTVQLPNFANGSPSSCVFEVQSPNGSAYINYNGNGAIPSRGDFISATEQNKIGKDDVWDYLLKSLADDPVFRFLTGAVLLTTELRYQEYQYDLQQWNMNYWTEDTAGNLVVASGVVIVPQGVTQASLLSFQHGTMLMKRKLPPFQKDRSWVLPLHSRQLMVMSFPSPTTSAWARPPIKLRWI